MKRRFLIALVWVSKKIETGLYHSWVRLGYQRSRWYALAHPEICPTPEDP
jgi:hypothetical protein